MYICSKHRAFIYTRGGETELAELTPLLHVRWGRIRDNISNARITVATTECCEVLGDVSTVSMELHIYRVEDDGIVWQGPITRVEYDWDSVTIYAEDVLWVAKRRVLEVGYDQSAPNIGLVIDRMDWLLRDRCFALDGDPWNVVPHLNPVTGPDDPQTARAVAAWSVYVWEDFDRYAENSGADYTVVNRDVYYWDTQYAWLTLPPMAEQWMSQFPRIVEYGYELATRVVVTDGEGHAGVSPVVQPWGQQQYYGIIDLLISNTDDQPSYEEPTPADIAQWTATATRNLEGRSPSPVGVVVPANTTLMPGAPWAVADMIPGAWFDITVDRMCRVVNATLRIHEVVVEEGSVDGREPSGETVSFTAVSAPANRIDPP